MKRGTERNGTGTLSIRTPRQHTGNMLKGSGQQPQEEASWRSVLRARLTACRRWYAPELMTDSLW
eukprot:3584854-Prorocentrum_lima.AAC.1